MTTHEPYRGSKPDDSAETIAAGEARDAALRHAERTLFAARDGRGDDARFEAEAAARAAAAAATALNQARRLGSQTARAEAHAARAQTAAARAAHYYAQGPDDCPAGCDCETCDQEAHEEALDRDQARW
jgi:hypothetical protein